METRRVIYITVFTILGSLLGFVFHLLLELALLAAIERKMHFLTMGLTASEWEHARYGVFLFWFLGGTLFGYVQGTYWWNYLYGHDVVVEPRTAKRKRAVIFGILVIIIALWYLTWRP